MGGMARDVQMVERVGSPSAAAFTAALNAVLAPLLNQLIGAFEIVLTDKLPSSTRLIKGLVDYDTNGATGITHPYQAVVFEGYDDITVTKQFEAFLAANPTYWVSPVVYRYSDQLPGVQNQARSSSLSTTSSAARRRGQLGSRLHRRQRRRRGQHRRLDRYQRHQLALQCGSQHALHGRHPGRHRLRLHHSGRRYGLPARGDVPDQHRPDGRPPAMEARPDHAAGRQPSRRRADAHDPQAGRRRGQLHGPACACDEFRPRHERARHPGHRHRPEQHRQRPGHHQRLERSGLRALHLRLLRRAQRQHPQVLVQGLQKHQCADVQRPRWAVHEHPGDRQLVRLRGLRFREERSLLHLHVGGHRQHLRQRLQSSSAEHLRGGDGDRDPRQRAPRCTATRSRISSSAPT